MISYVIPTHQRPYQLADTLNQLASLEARTHDVIGGAEVIIIDNASQPPVTLGRKLPNGWPVKVVRMTENLGAAARNRAAELARGEWLIMLDDDSHPVDAAHVRVLLDAPDHVAAIGADITLPNGQRESGGLPEVIVGCGAAIRREAFLNVGGYDADFQYYVEEYDLCARLIAAGWSIVHDLRFRVRHEKSAHGRDMDVILRRLVRNNGWVDQRYTPHALRAERLCETITRYGDIAQREHAEQGYQLGLRELFATIDDQPDRALPAEHFDRFTGRAIVRRTLRAAVVGGGIGTAMLINEAKHAWVVREALDELCVRITTDPAQADALVIGTLSPGPMLDAWLHKPDVAHADGAPDRPIVLPWRPQAFNARTLRECRVSQ